MASTMLARPSSPTPLPSVHASLPRKADLVPVLANIPTPEAFKRPSTPPQSPTTTPTDSHMPPGYIPRRRSAIIVTSTGPCSFTPRRRNALVPLPLLPPVPPDTIVTSVKILHNDGSNPNSTYSFGPHCHSAKNYGPEITCGGITFTNSFACSPPPRRRRSSLNPLACAAAAANVAAAAYAQSQTTARKESAEDATMTDATLPVAKAAADGNDELVTVVSSPTLTKVVHRNGEDKQPDSPTKTSFFFSPLARSRNQRRRTSCTPCNVPVPIQTTKAVPTKPSSEPTAPLPPTPTTPVPTRPTISIPMSPSMPSMPSTPMPTSPRPITPTVPATPKNSLDGPPAKPRSTIVVTVRKSPSAARHDAFAPPPSPWPRDSPFPWSNAYSGNPKPTRDLILPQNETAAPASPVTEAVANAMAMEVDPIPLAAEAEVQRPKAHRSVPAMHNPISLAGIRLMNERSRRFNMPHPTPGICPTPSIRRSGPAAPIIPPKPLFNRPRVSSRLVTRPFMTAESMDAASHTVLLGDYRVTAQLSPQFSADQLYISQPTLHPRLPGRTVSSSRLLSASRSSLDQDSTPTFSSGFSGSAYVARAAGIRSVSGKPMRAASKAASKNGGVPMLRTAVLNNSGPDIGRRILAMGVRLAHEIYEAEEDLARQEERKVEVDKMAMDLDVKEEPALPSLPPPPRPRYPRSRSQPRAQAQSQPMEKDTEMDVEKILEHYVTDGDVEMEDVQAERVDLNLKNEETPVSTFASNEKKELSQDTSTTAASTTKAAATVQEDDAKENRPAPVTKGGNTMATTPNAHNARDRRFSFEMV